MKYVFYVNLSMSMKIKLLTSLLLLFLSGISSVNAQLRKAELGIDGLTCSMCSRSTELSIRKLSFVEDVKMDLEKTTAEIYFKKFQNISFEDISKAVRDAGFSVRYLNVWFTTNSLTLRRNDCIDAGSLWFKYIGDKDTLVHGDVKFSIYAKSMMPSKEYKKWSSRLKEPCEAIRKTYFVNL